MRLLATGTQSLLMGMNSDFTTKPISANTDFKLPEDHINIHEVISSLALSNLCSAGDLQGIAVNAVAHALVVIGNRALLVYGNLTAPHYLRVPFDIQNAKGLSAAILFNPVINLKPTGKGYQEMRWNWSNNRISLFPYTQGKFVVYHQEVQRIQDKKKRRAVEPPVKLPRQPSEVNISRHQQLVINDPPHPNPGRVPLTPAVKNMQSSSSEVKSHAITAEEIEKASLKMKRAVIRETPDGVKIYNAFSSVIGGAGLDFDALENFEKHHSITSYSYGIETFGKYKISGELFSRLLVQLHAWPRNFILVVIANVSRAEKSVDHYFFFKNPDSDNENDIQYAAALKPKTNLESTIDFGIQNPQFVRILYYIDHFDSVVNGEKQRRIDDGNCFFYAVLGSMTPDMRRQFFANAGHEYNEDNYAYFEAMLKARFLTDIKVKELMALKERGKRNGMSDVDYNNRMNTLKEYTRYKGVTEDIKFIRQIMLKKFRENMRQYIEFFGLAERSDDQ